MVKFMSVKSHQTVKGKSGPIDHHPNYLDVKVSWDASRTMSTDGARRP